ncbi:MAG: hypothetical protein MUE42_12295 [Opitutaceae bacterium]|nr:hypothetical protein [Opitutaceae bacterium]
MANAFFEPLRVYPRWLVLLCAGIVAGAVLVLVARPLKWGLYLGLAGVLVLFLAALAWWLEQ